MNDYPLLSPQQAPVPQPETMASSVRDFLGDPAILDSEKLADYEGLSKLIETAIGPRDPIEEIWVRDIVDLVWETHLLRKLKVRSMVAAAPHGLDRALGIISRDAKERKSFVTGYTLKEQVSVANVALLLGKAGYDASVLEAETYIANLSNLERIDRLIAQTESRRNAILREIDRHRDSVAYHDLRVAEKAKVMDEEAPKDAQKAKDKFVKGLLEEGDRRYGYKS